MNKVIVSSKAFFERFRDWTFPHDFFVTVKVEKKVMDISAVKMSLESSNDFEMNVEGKAINKLVALCRVIEDQPITICFNSNYSIQIIGVIL